jgi:hypothetical protein
MHKIADASKIGFKASIRKNPKLVVAASAGRSREAPKRSLSHDEDPQIDGSGKN